MNGNCAKPLMESEAEEITINGKKYSLYFQSNTFANPDNKTAFCEDLAIDFLPVVAEDKEASDYQFQPDDTVFYQIQTNPQNKLCIIYVYSWPQAYTELEFGYYKQIQMHFDLQKKILEQIVISADGSMQDTDHHVHAFCPISSAKQYKETVKLSESFPYNHEKTPEITLVKRPMFELSFDNVSPVVTTPSFDKSFYAVTRDNEKSNYKKRSFNLEKLDEKTLSKWYLEDEVKFGHDLYDPFQSPHIFFVVPTRQGQTRQPQREKESEKKRKRTNPFEILSSKLSFIGKKKSENNL